MMSLEDVERQRLRAIVAADGAVLEELHDPNFVLCTPTGEIWDRATYLGGLQDRSINYLVFEPQRDISTLVSEKVGVVRYRSVIEISVNEGSLSRLQAWHLDAYAVGSEGEWRCLWSQATATT